MVPEPRWPQPQTQVQSQPHPSPVPERPVPAGGPSTVYYDLDEALAQAQPEPQAQFRRCRPRGTSNPLGRTRPGAAAGAEARRSWSSRRWSAPRSPIEPLRRPRNARAAATDHDSPPPPRSPDALVDSRPTPALEPRPAPRRARDPSPDARARPATCPRPTPAGPATHARGIAGELDLRVRLTLRRAHSPESRGATGRPAAAPRTRPAAHARAGSDAYPESRPAAHARPRSLPTPVVPATDSQAVQRVERQDVPQRVRPEATPAREATGPGPLRRRADRPRRSARPALRQFKGDSNLALWLFDHAGGADAAHAFARQAQRLQHAPTIPASWQLSWSPRQPPHACSRPRSCWPTSCHRSGRRAGPTMKRSRMRPICSQSPERSSLGRAGLDHHHARRARDDQRIAPQVRHAPGALVCVDAEHAAGAPTRCPRTATGPRPGPGEARPTTFVRADASTKPTGRSPASPSRMASLSLDQPQRACRRTRRKFPHRAARAWRSADRDTAARVSAPGDGPPLDAV